MLHSHEEDKSFYSFESNHQSATWSFASLLLTALEQTVFLPLLPYNEEQQLLLARLTVLPLVSAHKRLLLKPGVQKQ